MAAYPLPSTILPTRQNEIEHAQFHGVCFRGNLKSNRGFIIIRVQRYYYSIIRT